MDSYEQYIKELPANYLSLSGKEKLALIWQNILNTSYRPDALPIKKSNIFSLLNLIYKILMFKSFTSKSITHASDEKPKNREKLIHKFGSVAKILYRPQPNQPYTGLFSVEQECLLRLSLAISYLPNAGKSFIPGAAIKFFIDGAPSVNLILFGSFDGQGDNTNFFASELSTRMLPPKKLLFRFLNYYLGVQLKHYFNDPNLLSVHLPQHWAATILPNGQLIQKPNIPFQVTVIPQLTQSSDPEIDFRIKLQSIPEKTLLYKVLARDSLEADYKTIGDIILKSEFVASYYGDLRLFFQHHGTMPLEELK